MFREVSVLAEGPSVLGGTFCFRGIDAFQRFLGRGGREVFRVKELFPF